LSVALGIFGGGISNSCEQYKLLGQSIRGQIEFPTTPNLTKPMEGNHQSAVVEILAHKLQTD
jgi:hypothetical protein